MNPHYGKEALRSSLLHFLFGKFFNALASVLILTCLARWLSTDEYGAYVAFVALQATLLAVSTLGIETTAERFLPEFRTRYADDQLLGFVLASLGARLLSLLLLVAVGALAAGLIGRWVGLGDLASLLRPWMLAIACFGAFSFCCVLLEATLKQKFAQLCMSAYLAIKLALIFALQFRSQLDLQRLLLCELLASLAAAALAMTFLTRQFHRGGLRAGWKLVIDNGQRLGRFAAFNYAALCVFQLFSADVLKLLVARLVGVAGAASYGFAASLADMVQRYLPATLLQRLIKPVFVSRYVQNGDFDELNRMGRIILKLNLWVLVPAIALAATYGAELLGLLTQGKYAQGHWLFVGALCLLVPASHQAVLSMLAGTLERNGMQFYAGLLSGIGFPLALMLVPRLGPIGAVLAAAASALVYNTVATLYLRRAGYDYRPDWRAFGLFLGVGLLLGLGLHATEAWFDSWPARVGAMLLLLLGYAGLLRLASAFSEDERRMLNAVLPKPVFIL